MAKRGANEGSIFQRQDGRWSAVVDLGWEGGKRRRKTFYGATRKAVGDALNKALREKAQGLPVAVERQTVEQFLTRWLEASVRPSVRPLTYEQYEQHVRLYINPALGKVQLSKLSAPQVQAFINQQLKKVLRPRKPKVSIGNEQSDHETERDPSAHEPAKVKTLSSRTVRITLFVLRRALALAVKWEMATRNVADLVDGPKVEHHEVKPPTLDQVLKIFDVLKGDKFEALFTVCLALGLRRGETLGLRWEDVNFENQEISIKQALQRSGGKYSEGEDQRSKLRLVSPKSNRGIRTIAMPNCVASALRKHRARQAEERLRAGSEWQDYGLVFTTKKGTPIEPRRTDAKFKKVLKDAEVPETYRLHDSRHFASSLLLAQGVHPRTVMEILGHSEIGLTMNTYSHIVPDLMREAAKKIDAVLDGR